MEKRLLLECEERQTRLALLEDGDLSEIYIEREGHDKLIGNIYLGRVANVLPGMQAAFVDIGLEKNGFLFAGDIQVDKRDFDAPQDVVEQQLSAASSIKSKIKVGKDILVQVIKVPGGDKGPRISNNVTLPGRCVVLLPTVGYIGVSRRIEDEEERDRLRSMAEKIQPEGMGMIVRTAAEGIDEDTMRQDVDYLVRLWNIILDKAKYTIAPNLIHKDASLTQRAVRDMLLPDVDELIIDDARQYSIAKETAGMISASMESRIKQYTDSVPLFRKYSVESDVEKVLSRRVWLKSGGYLIFDYTEALTVIDVNTGKFVGKRSLSETVFQINCEAAAEIAKHLRLRDIGGIIVIDFIDMDKQEQKEELISILQKELKKDHTKTNLVGLTGLGLVEMTRKKVHKPIHTQLMDVCPKCQGMGMLLTDESIAISILHELRERREQSSVWLVETTKEIAEELMNSEAPKSVKAFVRVADQLGNHSYRIVPADESKLPSGSRLISNERKVQA